MSYAGPGRGIAKTVQTRSPIALCGNLFTLSLQRFDAKTMVDNPKVSASTGMVDDGTGVKEVGGDQTGSKKYLLAKNIYPVNICLHHYARKIEY